jgi:hypothetical protein
MAIKIMRAAVTVNIAKALVAMILNECIALLSTVENAS